MSPLNEAVLAVSCRYGKKDPLINRSIPVSEAVLHFQSCMRNSKVSVALRKSLVPLLTKTVLRLERGDVVAIEVVNLRNQHIHVHAIYGDPNLNRKGRLVRFVIQESGAIIGHQEFERFHKRPDLLERIFHFWKLHRIAVESDERMLVCPEAGKRVAHAVA